MAAPYSGNRQRIQRGGSTQAIVTARLLQLFGWENPAPCYVRGWPELT